MREHRTLSSKISFQNQTNSPNSVGKDTTVLWFSENRLLPLLFGEHDRYLARIEESYKLRISSRGNRVSIAGEKSAVKLGKETLNALYQRLEKNLPVDNAEVDAAIRLASDDRNKDVMRSKHKEISNFDPSILSSYEYRKRTRQDNR